MAFIDYYKTLGIDKNVSADDIKKAYRKLARKHHPDLNPNDKEAIKKFQQINEANEVLSNPENRKKYDEYGENWQHAEQYQHAGQGSQSQQYAGDASGYTTGSGDFSDFFESMFGGAGGRTGRREAQYKGQDYTSELHLKLRDIMKTHQHTLTINGKNIRITVPAGIANGQVIKLKGYGGPGANNGPGGDLYITFVIADDPEYKRVNNDLYTTVAVDLYSAILGGEITVESLEGKVKLKVAPGTQNGTKVRLKNKGLPVYKKEGNFGDLIVTYAIKIPVNLNEDQKKIFQELSESSL